MWTQSTSAHHNLHCENTLMCLDAGKPVLCEKPVRDQQRRQKMIARARKIFLMEAMWTRFLPTLVRTREIIAAGTIGEVRMLTADFGFRTSVNPEGAFVQSGERRQQPDGCGRVSGSAGAYAVRDSLAHHVTGGARSSGR